MASTEGTTGISSSRAWLLIGAGLCIALTLYIFGLPDRNAAALPVLSEYSQLPALKSTDRITVVSPHLDDETLGVGGLISQARQRNLPVSVIFMTNGDDYPIATDRQFKTGYPTPDELIQFGVHRQGEALLALQKLGVPADSTYFLGLPDRGLKFIVSPKYATTPYESPGTLRNSSPYSNSYITNLSYSGVATREALTKAIQQTNPTIVLTTLPEDVHSDHSATAAFVQQVLPAISTHPKLYFFLIHYSHYPRPGGISSSLPLLPPAKLENRPWEVVYLSTDQVNQKQQALSQYGSQLRIPFSGNLLRSFVRQNELVLPK